MRYYCWSGYTSVLVEDHFVAPKADLKVLKRVAEDEAAPRLDRTAAAFTRGYCLKQAGNREAAARAYRLAIELGQGATPEERARSVILSDQATSTWQPQASGKHFVSACYQPPPPPPPRPPPQPPPLTPTTAHAPAAHLPRTPSLIWRRTIWGPWKRRNPYTLWPPRRTSPMPSTTSTKQPVSVIVTL